jgi:hypothetical protein
MLPLFCHIDNMEKSALEASLYENWKGMSIINFIDSNSNLGPARGEIGTLGSR